MRYQLKKKNKISGVRKNVHAPTFGQVRHTVPSISMPEDSYTKQYINPLPYDSSLRNLENALRGMDTPVAGLLYELDRSDSRSKNGGNDSPVKGFNLIEEHPWEIEDLNPYLLNELQNS